MWQHRHWKPSRQIILGMLICVVALSAGRTLADQPDVPVDPFEGLSEDETIAAQAAASDRWEAEQRAFVMEFERSGRDPRSLDRAGLMLTYGVPATDLEGASKFADVVILGTVEKTEFGGGGTLGAARVTIAVKEFLKGSAKSPVFVYQVGGPVLDGGHEYLAESGGDPILLPGDEVLLFLITARQHPTKGDGFQPGFEVIPAIGSYVVAQDRVSTPGSNPLYEQLQGITKDDLVRAVRESIH